jgi:hypothetical protein
MEIDSIRTPGLGDATYLLSHNGLGVVVDPQRDIDRFDDWAPRCLRLGRAATHRLLSHLSGFEARNTTP